ncbi:MAG: LacI family DNA-binding transcriptional regulator [Rhizobiaceae bacterium]
MSNSQQKTNPTSEDVARLANVSQSAVSRTFTPGASVSAKTRDKVMKAAEELGYRPNALARAVISGKSRLIALLVAYLDNQFYPIVIEKLSRVLQDNGYQMLLMMTETGNQDRLVQRILQYQVEGIVMASASLSSDLARECAQTGIPVVMLNRYVATSPASSVTSDNIEGGRLIADFLVRGGHGRIAYIAGAEDASTNRDREAGFYRGLAEHGQAVHDREVGGYTFEGAAQAARILLSARQRPDAIFVANDHMAFSVMDVARREFGLSIPGDISIAGYDDVPEAAWGGYDLTTVSQSPDAMVAATAKILMEQIEKSVVNKRASVLPAKLIVRGSARLPAR